MEALFNLKFALARKAAHLAVVLRDSSAIPKMTPSITVATVFWPIPAATYPCLINRPRKSQV